MEAEIGGIQPQTKEHQGSLATIRSRKGRGRMLPRAFHESAALPAPWVLTSDLQDCERVSLC